MSDEGDVPGEVPENSVFDNVVFWVGYAIGFLPWLALFFSQWKRSLFPCAWLEELCGEKESPAGLRGKLKFIVMPGALSLFMNLVLWITMLPASFEWDTFPKFCVTPRTFRGLMNIHQMCWNHFGFLHFANNNFCVWTLGPLVLTYGRRTFVSSIFFINFVGGFILWLSAPGETCTAGFSGVLFGWFGALSLALFLECPPKWWRVLLLLIVGGFLGGNFYSEVAGGDDEEGTSWHGHLIGFCMGLVYSFLRFYRKWFLFVGLENRVRPLDGKTTFCQACGRLIKEFSLAIKAGGIDTWEFIRCRPPQDLQDVPAVAKATPAESKLFPPSSSPMPAAVGAASDLEVSTSVVPLQFSAPAASTEAQAVPAAAPAPAPAPRGRAPTTGSTGSGVAGNPFGERTPASKVTRPSDASGAGNPFGECASRPSDTSAEGNPFATPRHSENAGDGGPSVGSPPTGTSGNKANEQTI